MSERKPFGQTVLDSLSAHYERYVLVGGMPEAVLESMKSSPTGFIAAQNRAWYSFDSEAYRLFNWRVAARIIGCMESASRNMASGDMKLRFGDIEGRKNVGRREYAQCIDYLGSSGMATVCRDLREPVRPLDGNTCSGIRLYAPDTGIMMAIMGERGRAIAVSGSDAKFAESLAEHSVANMLERCGMELFHYTRDRTENGRTDRIKLDFVAELGTELAAIDVRIGQGRAMDSLKKLQSDPGYSGYGFRRFIRFRPGDIFTDDDGIENYPPFAAAFADSMVH